MSEITTHANSLLVAFPGRTRCACKLVAKGQMTVDIIDDCLHASPAARGIAEQRPSQGRQAIRFAIAASEQEANSLVGELRDWHFGRPGRYLVGQARILDHEVRAQFQYSG